MTRASVATVTAGMTVSLDPKRLRLEKLEVREVGVRTSLGFRVVTG